MFGGWDIFEDNSYEAAKTAGVLEKELLEQIRPELEQITPMARGVRSPVREAARRPERQEGARTRRDLADQLREDIRRFKDEHGLDRLVMVWCGSTEIYLTESPVHASIEAFEKALEANDATIPSSMVYAYAAIKEGIPYANAAPNLSADVPALIAARGADADRRSPARI